MSLQEARQSALEKHNELRALHHDIPPMTMADDLNEQAQAWADHLLKLGSMSHSTSAQRPSQGENLHWKRDSRGVSYMDTALHACRSWYKEIKDYDWESHTNHTGVVGHFTQLIWKGSTELGIGIAMSDTVAFTVGRYRSKGNWRGRYEANVTPLKSGTDQPEPPAEPSANCSKEILDGNSGNDVEMKFSSLKIVDGNFENAQGMKFDEGMQFGMKSTSTSTTIENGTETKTVTTSYGDGTTTTEVFVNGVKQ